MYKSSILSVGLHFTIFFFAYYGLPDVKKHTVKEVPIDIVLDLPIKNKTNIKETTKKKSLKNKNSSNPQPKANLPKAEPIVSVKKPKIKKIQKSKKEIEKLAKKPKIKKKNIIKKKNSKKFSEMNIPKKLPKRKIKSDKQKKLMASGILKTLTKAAEKTKKEKKSKNADDLKNKLLAAVNSQTNKKIKKKLSLGISEIDMVKNHVQTCWNLPYGGTTIKDKTIDLKIKTNPDGSVVNVDIIDKKSYNDNPIFRATADAARRAVKDCSPLPTNSEKYDLWKNFTFQFDPDFY